MMDTVDWKAESFVVLGPGERVAGGILFAGTLADAVVQFLDLPEPTREQAEIVIVNESGAWDTWLTLADIEELGLRPDYPLRA